MYVSYSTCVYMYVYIYIYIHMYVYTGYLRRGRERVLGVHGHV